MNFKVGSLRTCHSPVKVHCSLEQTVTARGHFRQRQDDRVIGSGPSDNFISDRSLHRLTPAGKTAGVAPALSINT